MLSYKKWKKINENFGVTLGVKTPGKIAELHSKWDEMGMGGMPMPMKSKKSKKMFGGDDGPDMGSGPDDHLGGGDDGGGGAPPFMKKKPKGKKPPFGGHDDGPPDDDDAPDLDADMDGDDMGPGPGDDGPDHDDDGDDDGPPPDMGDDDGDGDDDDMGGDLGDGDDDDMGGDDAGPGVGGPEGGPMHGPGDAPALKKKGGSFIDKTKAVADGAKMMHKGASKMIKGMKEGVTDGLTKKWAKKSKKMTKEENEFWRSLQSQTGATKFTRESDGSWNPVSEDAVIPPTNPNANITQDDEPGPGETGYAPQGRIGSFTEWAAKYQRKSKINESKKR